MRVNLRNVLPTFVAFVATTRAQAQTCCDAPFYGFEGDIVEMNPPPSNAGHAGGGSNAQEAENSVNATFWKEQRCLSTSEDTYVSILLSDQDAIDEIDGDGNYFFDSGVAQRQTSWSGNIPAGNYDSFFIHGDKQGPVATFEFSVTFQNPIVAIVYRNRPGYQELLVTDEDFGYPGTTYSQGASSRGFELDGANNWMKVSGDKHTLSAKMVVHHNMNDIRVITEACCDCGQNSGASGDPHFKTWTGEHYDYHGLCDLVLLENHGFQNDLGMDIHIRTKQIKSWSYISNVVLRIGHDSLEITGGEGRSHFWINGMAGEEIKENEMILPLGLSGYPIKFRRENSQQHKYIVDLGNDEMIIIKTWKDMVGLDIHGATDANFGKSRGLMGSFHGGKHIARDDVTVLKDLNAFGQEWQVLESQPKLFHDVEGSQHPNLCIAPSAVDMRRRLGESSFTQEMAEAACSHVNRLERGNCIFDVLATNDIDSARIY